MKGGDIQDSSDQRLSGQSPVFYSIRVCRIEIQPIVQAEHGKVKMNKLLHRSSSSQLYWVPNEKFYGT